MIFYVNNLCFKYRIGIVYYWYIGREKTPVIFSVGTGKRERLLFYIKASV